MLEPPASAPGATIVSTMVGAEALNVLDQDANARRSAAEAMRRAHDHGWVVVARGDLSGSVVCHAEAFFESMAAAEQSAYAIECPAGAEDVAEAGAVAEAAELRTERGAVGSVL